MVKVTFEIKSNILFEEGVTSFTGHPGGFFCCDAGDRKRAIFQGWSCVMYK